MRYKRVAKIDFDFSVIGFGCWGASGSGSWTDHTDEEQIKAIRTAIDQGVNFFDVAPIYGMGHAEEVLGKAVKGLRDKVFIATKAGIPLSSMIPLLYNEYYPLVTPPLPG